MGETSKRRKICNYEDKPSEQKCKEFAYSNILKTKLVLAVIFL